MNATDEQAILKVRGLSKVYQMGELIVNALNNVSLDLYAGELAVILGASGSGKSTLLNIMGGLDIASSGELFYKEENLSQVSERQLTNFRRMHVGFVFQFYNLIPSLTANENVALVTDIAPDAMAPEADGTIYRLFEENERVLAAGTPLLEISNEDELEIVVDLLTQDAVKVKTGDRMLITGWGGDNVLEALISYIEPEAFTKFSALGVEEQRVNVIANFIDTPAILGAEYRIEASVIIWQEDDVLLIPTSAIFQRNNAWYTFVAEDGKAILKQVAIGNRNQEFAEVTGLLEAGETIILFPSDLIEQGVKLSF